MTATTPAAAVGYVLEGPTRDLVAEVLSAGAVTRRRAAEALACELEAAKVADPKRDIRGGAMQVLRALAEARSLESIVGDLTEVAPDPSPPPDVTVDPDIDAARAVLGAPPRRSRNTTAPTLPPVGAPGGPTLDQEMARIDAEDGREPDPDIDEATVTSILDPAAGSNG